MTFSNGSTIAYTYDANGRKLRTVHNVGGTTTTTDYAGNVIYENGVQKKLLTEEGYVDLTSGTYYYYLKDHQGNNRVVVNSGGTVTETNHYYPFGGTFASGTVQPYKYNGKELDMKAGLNWYDYGARHYDAALGRFLTVDPLAEKYYGISSYVYCGNNPVNRIDPTGMIWDDVKEIKKLVNRIDKKISSLNGQIENNMRKLEKGGLSEKKMSRLNEKISEARQRISYLKTSKSDIAMLGNDTKNIYAFNHVDGGMHQVRKGDDDIVYIDTSSDAMSIHEITHVRQSLTNGGLKFSNSGELYNVGTFAPLRNRAKMISQMEIEAYRFQYSYNKSFPGRANNLQGIDVHSVGNIINANGQFVYPSINLYSRFLLERNKLK